MLRKCKQLNESHPAYARQSQDSNTGRLGSAFLRLTSFCTENINFLITGPIHLQLNTLSYSPLDPVPKKVLGMK